MKTTTRLMASRSNNFRSSYPDNRMHLYQSMKLNTAYQYLVEFKGPPVPAGTRYQVQSCMVQASWRGVPINITMTQNASCLVVRYKSASGSEHQTANQSSEQAFWCRCTPQYQTIMRKCKKEAPYRRKAWGANEIIAFRMQGQPAGQSDDQISIIEKKHHSPFLADCFRPKDYFQDLDHERKRCNQAFYLSQQMEPFLDDHVKREYLFWGGFLL